MQVLLSELIRRRAYGRFQQFAGIFRYKSKKYNSFAAVCHLLQKIRKIFKKILQTIPLNIDIVTCLLYNIGVYEHYFLKCNTEVKQNV